MADGQRKHLIDEQVPDRVRRHGRICADADPASAVGHHEGAALFEPEAMLVMPPRNAQPRTFVLRGWERCPAVAFDRGIKEMRF